MAIYYQNQIRDYYYGGNVVNPTVQGKIYYGGVEVNPGFTYLSLLDEYPNAAAAYSLRLLNNAYTGNAIRVRRSSDNAEQDIGFSSGVLNTSALTTFCGSDSGFVTTWYDQSGNSNNATQTTAANQPLIISSSIINSENGKPSLNFDGTNDSLFLTNIVPASNWSIFGVGAKKTSIKEMTFLSNTSSVGSGFFWAFNDSINLYNQNGGSTYNGVGYDSLLTLFSGFVISTVPNSIFRNNTLYSTISSSFSVTQDFTRIGQRGSGGFSHANISEIILYQTNQISNNSAISTNINSFYSIY